LNWPTVVVSLAVDGTHHVLLEDVGRQVALVLLQ